MRHLYPSLMILSITAALASADAFANALAARQTNDAQTYLNSVCLPNVTNPVPPCQQIANIESTCAPNGTDPIDYVAHQECMCGGGYFPNWIGCLNCLYVHGARSQAQSSAFAQIMTSASNILCTGTPTASFAAIFSSLSDANPVVASTAGTGMTDLYPSQTAVSLYYTASGNQQPGVITGSATAATHVSASTTARSSSPTTATPAGTSGSGSGGSNSGSGTGSGTGSAASKTSSSGAAPSNILGGILGIVAGGVAAAVL